MTTTTLELRRDFAYYSAMDPRITALLAEAQAVKPSDNCGGAAWFRSGGLRGKVRSLVGYGRLDALRELRTSFAYSVVYQRIYGALPRCPHCEDRCAR